MQAEERVSTESVFEGRIIKVRVDRVTLPGGRESTREVVEHAPAVVVAPIDADDNVLLVRQFRWAAAVPLLEAPAGMLEDGEAPEDGARRELREETGHAAGSLVHLGSFWMAPGYSTEYMYTYLATDLRPDPLPADEDEDIELVPVPWDDIPRLIREGDVRDAKTVAALQLAYFLYGKG